MWRSEDHLVGSVGQPRGEKEQSGRLAGEGIVNSARRVHGGRLGVGSEKARDAVGVRFRCGVAEKAARVCILGNVVLVGQDEGAAAQESYPTAVDAVGIGADVDAVLGS